MKQQEILRKIGNILKELNEQYEYLQAEDAHINDLELELFAANAKFLTDHNEILRKINAQAQNVKLALPEHHEAEELHTNPGEPEQTNGFVQINETLLPTMAESAVNYGIEPEPETTDNHYSEYVEPIEYTTETEQNHEQTVTENEQPVAEQYTDTEQSFSFEQTQEIEPEHEQSVAETETEEENPVSIEPTHERDSYGFIHHDEPTVIEEKHTFNLNSSYPEEESTLSQVDFNPAEPKEEQFVEAQDAQPAPAPVTYESIMEKYGTPVSTPPTEPEPLTPDTVNGQEAVLTHEAYEPVRNEVPEPEPVTPEAKPTETFAEREVIPPVEEEKPMFTHEANQHVEEQKTFQTYTPPVTPEPEQPLSLHERLAAQLRGHEASPAAPSHQQQVPVTDIKSAINLNDRMLYVKDLFNGYGMAYNEAIELLNRYKNFEEADKFLKMNYVTKNRWEEKPATVDKFYEVLHRRFPQ